MKYAFKIFTAATQAVKRFPLVWISSLIASTAMSIMIGDNVTDERQMQLALMAQTFALGVPLFFALSLFTESITSIGRRIFVLVSGILLLIGVYFYLKVPVYGFNRGELSLEFLGCFLAFHLMVSFLPVQKHLNTPIFWHFNKTLFLRLAITALYTGVLFAGLAGAMAAFDQLLGFEIKPIYYGRLWMYMAGLGSVWLFLSNIPEDLSETVDSGYPKGLQVFAQYILLPLVLLYLVILYVYGSKILYLGSLPVGWVSNLILAFSVLGMLALLLLHPLAQNSTQKWINRFTSGFYLALIPLLVLLFTAALTRIHAYGFTELRYALLCLAIWLSGVTIFMILTRNRFIWAIPVSLFFTVLVVFFIPGLDLRSQSKKSQKSRLETMLKEQNMQDAKGHLIAAPKALNDSISNEMYELTEYLSINHGITGLEPVVNIPDSMRWQNESRWELMQYMQPILAAYGIQSRNPYTTEAVAEATVSENTDPNGPVAPISRADLSIRFKGETPNLVNIPKGMWLRCMDLNITSSFNFRFYSKIKDIVIQRDITGKNILIETKNYKEVFNLDSIMQKHAPLYQNLSLVAESNPYYFFPDYRNPLLLENKNASLQIFSMRYKWNEEQNTYSLLDFNGKLWLR